MMRELTVRAVIEDLPTVTAFAEDVFEQIDCPMKVQMQLQVVIDEIAGNIARYAYGEEEGQMTIRFAYEPPVISLTFADSGQPYNPLQNRPPDITLSAEERKIGGLGIHLVRKLTDEAFYEYVDGQNRLTVRKNTGG